MKRLISLLLLLWCSLTFCDAANAQQTWRLTNDAFSDTLPKIVFDTSGVAHIVWLRNDDGDMDVCKSSNEGSAWSSPTWLHRDNIDQRDVEACVNRSNNSMWVVWDSATNGGYYNVQGALVNCNTGSFQHYTSIRSNVLDYLADHGDSRLTIESNTVNDTYLGYSDSMSLYVARFSDSTWDTGQIVKVGYNYGTGSCQLFSTGISCYAGNAPMLLAYSKEFYYGMGYYRNIFDFYWRTDNNSWDKAYVYSNILTGQRAWLPLDVRALDDSTFIALYSDSSSEYPGHNIIMAKRFCKNDTVYIQTDTQTIAQALPRFVRAGAITDINQPVFAYSNGSSIYGCAYTSAAWATPPTALSDTSLHNCINPDIVAENDSTVWVCYQNDGDIYVTRTSVPMGISEQPTVQIPNPQSKIGLKSWPNPARNVIHFSYTLPAKRNSSVSIYDIAGRLVKNLEIRGDQINWNCADNAGRRVASGVYFARLRSGGQETIQRISIIK